MTRLHAKRSTSWSLPKRPRVTVTITKPLMTKKRSTPDSPKRNQSGSSTSPPEYFRSIAIAWSATTAIAATPRRAWIDSIFWLSTL